MFSNLLLLLVSYADSTSGGTLVYASPYTLNPNNLWNGPWKVEARFDPPVYANLIRIWKDHNVTVQYHSLNII